MTAFAGIDFDSHAVHVILKPEEGPAEYHRYELGKEGRAFDRARLVRDAMPSRSWWLDEGVVAIGIEEPMRHRGGSQALMVIQGAILACLPPSLLVHPMMPNQWRKEVGLAGNATKFEVALFVRVCAGMENFEWPQDACDAYCLALAVQKLTVLS